MSSQFQIRFVQTLGRSEKLNAFHASEVESLIPEFHSHFWI